MDNVSGTIGWGDVLNGQQQNQVKLPVVLNGADNVRSVQLSAEFDAGLVSVDAVESTLPDGWQLVHNVESGVLRVAMAGAKPAANGEVATITLTLSGDNQSPDISGNYALNTAPEQQIGATGLEALPESFTLESNYPNPFRSSTTIGFELPEETEVVVEVYNVLGQRVETLVNEKMSAGRHEVNFEASNLSSGMYLYRMKAGSFVETGQMTVVK